MSNNLKNAYEKIISFIESDTEKTILITGTHQYKKHSLVLDILENHYDLKHGLLRSNSLDNIALFLEQAGYNVKLNKKFNSGDSYKIGTLSIQFDSIFSVRTWNNTNRDLDFAIIYPMDSFCEKDSKAKDRLIKDILEERNIRKVFIVSWTDTRHEYDWLNGVVDRKVIYDAEEDDIDYHNRVLNQNKY